MDFALTESQELIKKEVGALARTFSLDYWLDKDDRALYPSDFVKAFADNGWLGITIPEEYGGAGLGVTEAALMLHEICASGAGTSGCSPIHFYVFPPTPLVKYGTEAMKRKYLPRIVSGDIVMAFGVTEPNAGTDTSRIQTRAVKTGRPLGGERPEGLDDERAARQQDPAARAHRRPRSGAPAQRDDVVLRRLRSHRDHGAPDPQARARRRRLQRDLHRQPGDPGRGRGRHAGRGLLPPARLAQPRAHRDRDRGGRHRARRARPRGAVRQGARSSSTGRSGRTRPSRIRWPTRWPSSTRPR